MYNPDNISEKYYTKYNKLINLLQKKGSTSDKYAELKDSLMYFQSEKPNMNNDELKLLKNVIIIANSILYKAEPKLKNYKEQKEQCLEICSNIKK